MLPALKPDLTTRATNAQVLQALASLAGLPSRQADDANLDKEMYFVALEGVSRWALSEGVKAIMRGALDHTFFPSPVELKKQCDKAMEPVIRQAQREKQVREQTEENRRYQHIRQTQTPQSRERAQSIYRQFCEQHEAAKPKPLGEPETVYLDPAEVAKLPDAKTPFKRAKVA